MQKKLAQRTLKKFSGIKYTGDFNVFLHELRSRALTTLKTPKKLLSAGCSGLWYFEWIDKYLGKPEKHIGLEFYSEKPENLPAHVNWIQQNVFDMSAVQTQSVDMVFSGQNVEHLWPSELAGFLMEANRILEEDGLLVIDSPNFPVCQSYCWSHPEHIIEFSVPQFVVLLGLSGFQVEQCIGLWGCKINNQLLPMVPGQISNSRLSRVIARTGLANNFLLRKRISYGLRHPEHSFLWWIVARKNGAPNVAKHQLLDVVESQYSLNWPSRIQRQSLHPSLKYNAETDVVTIPKSFHGASIYGPYFPLKPGRYTLGYLLSIQNIENHTDTKEVIAIIDCAIGPEGKVIASREIMRENITENYIGLFSIDVTLEELTFGVQVRLISNGVAELLAYRTIYFIQDK